MVGYPPGVTQLSGVGTHNTHTHTHTQSIPFSTYATGEAERALVWESGDLSSGHKAVLAGHTT